MFTKPKNGWTSLKLGNFEDRASYMTDVPNDCLDAFIQALEYYDPCTIYFDAEGWDYFLIIHHSQSYIVHCKNETPEVFVIDLTNEQLAQKLIDNIELYLDEWAGWLCYDDNIDLEANKTDLLNKISILKNLIKK